MPPTTVEQPASLEPQQRDWLKKMAATLAVKLEGPAPPVGVAAKGPSVTAEPPSAPIPTRAAKSPGPGGPPEPVQERTPKSPEQVAYETERDAVKALVEPLSKHVHKAHIAGELSSINTELGKAKKKAEAKSFPDAMTALTKAKETAGKAKDFVDKYDAYAKKKAEANAMVRTFKDILTEDDNLAYLNARIQSIKDADNLVKPPGRDYAGATTKVEGVYNDLTGVINDWYVTPNTPKIAALKTGPTKTLLAKEIKAIEDEMAVLNANIAAKEYRKALFQGPRVNQLIRMAEESTSRRNVFDAQRVTTVAAIDALKAFKALTVQMDDLNKRLKAADELGSVETNQFERGAEALKKIESDAKALATNGPAAETYATDRAAADKDFAELSKHKQAAAQKPLLDGIKTKLDKAAELAKEPAKIAAANAELKLATQNIGAAKSMLGVADAMGIIAGVAADAASAKQSLDALKISLEAARKFKSAADFANEFKAIDAKVASAETKLKGPKTVPDAIQEIMGIGDDIAKLFIQLTQQEGYGAERAAVEERLKKVKALPEAAEIQANITPVETALKEAETEDKAHAFDKRAVAMEKAREAADLAEKTAEQAKSYKTQKQTLETSVTGSALSAADKKQVTDAIKAADKEAKTLKYDEATKLLKNADATFETLQINGLAKKTPLDANAIEAAAKRMMDSGNAKEIDKLIQKLPNNTQFEVLKRLAKARFGVELASNPNWSATQSGKRLLLLMSKVPEDVRDNPSLKLVDRRKSTENGGWYEPGNKAVVVNGRPGDALQRFGAGLPGELPKDIEPNCKPKNENAVDYFDFTALHELGHSVDDKLQFMAAREGKAEFGTWKTYGGIDAIANAIATWAEFDSTPEQKQAVSDLIQGNKVTWPDPPAAASKEDKKKWNDAKKKVMDWHKLATFEGIWESHSKTTKINVNGTVYQEAYKMRWVSYAFDARKHGLTGYQFRAPGEWFAELYAAYRSDKLQDSHPAISWLSKLTV